MIDVTQQINSVRRVVGTRVLDAGQARAVTISRTYAAAIEDVWDACTNAERIPRWFLPVSGDLRLGGHYQLQGNAGGTIERCDPPKSFFATWEFGGLCRGRAPLQRRACRTRDRRQRRADAARRGSFRGR